MSSEFALIIVLIIFGLMWLALRLYVCRKGHSHLLKGAFKAADRWNRLALLLLPGDQVAHYGLGLSAWLRGDVEQVLDHFEHIRRDNARNVYSIQRRIIHATLLTEIRRYDDALSLLAEVDPRHIMASHAALTRSYVHLRTRDYEKVEPVLNEVEAFIDRVRNAPNLLIPQSLDARAYCDRLNTSVISQRSLLYAAHSKFEAVVDCCDQLATLCGDHVEILSYRGEARYMLGDHISAFNDFRRATQLSPSPVYLFQYTGRTIATATAGLAVTHHALGQIDEAQALWRDLTAENPRFRDLYWLKDELRWPQAMIDHAAQLDQTTHADASSPTLPAD
jgi:tetratricopeptide (TPR) repeat protein